MGKPPRLQTVEVALRPDGQLDPVVHPEPGAVLEYTQHVVLRHGGELVDGGGDLSGGGHRCRDLLSEIHHDQRKAVHVRLQPVEPGPALF